MIVTREKVYWLVMVDYKYEFAEEEKNCILRQSELIRVVFEVCVMRGESGGKYLLWWEGIVE